MFPFGPFELSILVIVNLTSQRIDWTEKLSDSHLQGNPANNQNCCLVCFTLNGTIIYKRSSCCKLTSKVFVELIDGVSIRLIFLYTSIESDFSLTLSFKALTH